MAPEFRKAVAEFNPAAGQDSFNGGRPEEVKMVAAFKQVRRGRPSARCAATLVRSVGFCQRCAHTTTTGLQSSENSDSHAHFPRRPTEVLLFRVPRLVSAACPDQSREGLVSIVDVAQLFVKIDNEGTTQEPLVLWQSLREAYPQFGARSCRPRCHYAATLSPLRACCRSAEGASAE